MCLLQKKHIVLPLKMIHRYSRKWYMPAKTKQLYGLSKARAMLKRLKNKKKKQRNKILTEMPIRGKKYKGISSILLTKSSLPVSPKKKRITFFRKKQIKFSKYKKNKKYNKYKYTKFPKFNKYNIKTLKVNLKQKKKKYLVKKYLKNLLVRGYSPANQLNKIGELINNIGILNLYYQKTKLIQKIDLIKKQVLKKNKQAFLLKKRMNVKFGFLSKYYLNFDSLQKAILATKAFLRKKRQLKKRKKAHLFLNLLKAKQSLTLSQLKGKEKYIYNNDILTRNFIEPELRKNWGITPATNLVNYLLTKIKGKIKLKKKNIKRKRKNILILKKIVHFRLKKKKKKKKHYSKKLARMYKHKKGRITFADRSYTKLKLKDVKHFRVKWKRRPFSLLNTQVRKAGISLKIEKLSYMLKKHIRIVRKKKKSLLFLSPKRLIKKMERDNLFKTKIQLKDVIKKKFSYFLNLIKIHLKKNKKKIRKYTRKILFLKKQKTLAHRKLKIRILNLRELLIRENQKLRAEIKEYKYTWKNSPFYNYDYNKTSKLNLIVNTRKQKKSLINIMKKYPEGIDAIKARLKTSKYYTGLSLLKRKLE